MRAGSLFALLVLLVSAIARADAPPPPATPTVFLAIDNRDGRLKTLALQSAVKAALGALPKGFSLRVVGGDPGTVSQPFSRTEQKRILSELVRAAGPTSFNGAAGALILATSLWTSSGASPRHHIVLVSSSRPLAMLHERLWYCVRDGFTVSLLSLLKLDAKERKEFEEKGAGRAKFVNEKTLAAALRAELAWGKLSKADEKKLAGARTSKLLGVLGRTGGGGGGLVGVLRSSSGVGSAKIGGLIGGSVGGAVGGLGLRGRGYGYGSSPRLRRGEALVGSKLALGFREVACKSCDVAEVRRAWLQSAGSLLTCLEGSATAGEVSVELGASGKAVGSGPAASCASSWYAKQARSGVSAKLLVGPASSVP